MADTEVPQLDKETCTAVPSTRKRRSQSELETQFTKSMETVQQLMKARMEKKAAPDDEDDISGKLVAAECKKIKSNHVKRVFKKKVMDLLFEAQEEDEGTSNDVLQYIVLQPGQLATEQ